MRFSKIKQKPTVDRNVVNKSSQDIANFSRLEQRGAPKEASTPDKQNNSNYRRTTKASESKNKQPLPVKLEPKVGPPPVSLKANVQRLR